jgi:hypothetical protein
VNVSLLPDIRPFETLPPLQLFDVNAQKSTRYPPEVFTFPVAYEVKFVPPVNELIDAVGRMSNPKVVMTLPKLVFDVLKTVMPRVTLLEVKLVTSNWRIPPYGVPAGAHGMVVDPLEVNVKFTASAITGTPKTSIREKLRPTRERPQG